METIKLEKSGNFMWVTDLQTNTITRFPAKDTYYAFENRNKVLVITWDKNNGETYHRYNVSELVDSNEDPWSSFSALDTFLASNLGFNGGGGTSGTTQSLSETLTNGNNTGGTDILLNSSDAIQLENFSSIEKGTHDFGADGGISRICGVGYEDMWQAGIRHVFDSNGYIRHSTNGFEVIPDNTFDKTKRFKYGSLWTLDDGTTYKCIDDTVGAAVWELYSSPKYKVFTALLTQSGGDTPTLSMDGPLVIGVTYEILDDDSSTVDFTNVGAPNNNIGTFFVATGTTPNSWGVNLLGQLLYNTGAPVATVLENTIGNIWFTYVAAGHYRCYSDNLFTSEKTTIFIGETVNKSNPTDRLQLRVLCATDNQNQPAFLDIFSGTISVTYEDDVISTPSLRFATTFEIRVYN